MNIVQQIVTGDNVIFMLRCAGWSLLIAVCALLFGTCFGVLGAAGRISKNKFFYSVAAMYVEFIRGTPMLLQIYFLFLGLPAITRAITGTPLNINVYLIGMIAMSINSGAYCTELFRSAIQAVEKGQWEAATALGLGYFDTMRFIILPQAFRRIIPPLVSEFVTLIKDSSLIGTIGAVELLQSTKVLGVRYYNYIIPLLMATVLYLTLTLTISNLSRRLERRLAVHD